MAKEFSLYQSFQGEQMPCAILDLILKADWTQSAAVVLFEKQSQFMSAQLLHILYFYLPGTDTNILRMPSKRV